MKKHRNKPPKLGTRTKLEVFRRARFNLVGTEPNIEVYLKDSGSFLFLESASDAGFRKTCDFAGLSHKISRASSTGPNRQQQADTTKFKVVPPDP